MSFDPVIWTIVIGYVAVIFTKGIRRSRHIESSDDYLVAGRNVGWFALFCTMGATVIGGGASIGAIGRTYDWGLLMVMVSMGWYLHFILSGLVVAPRFREAKLYTVAGYFGHRFDERSRFSVMILSLLFSVFIVAAQMAAFGTVLSAILPQFADAGLVLSLAIIIGGLLVVIYSTAGGLMAVIHTDIFQFLILIAGFVITLVLTLPDIFAAWPMMSDRIAGEFFELDGGKGWVFLVTTFLAFFLGETFAPGYATRYCVGRTIRATRQGIAGVGFFLAAVFPLILFFIALYARWYFPEIDPQQALPLVIKQLNNPVAGGLIIGALLMAVMSSADSALNSATAIFVKDLFEHQMGWTGRDDARTLRIARICTAALGLLAIAIAVLWSDIIGLLLLTYHIWAPGIIVPVLVGAVTQGSNASINAAVFYSIIIAVSVSLLYKSLPLLNATTLVRIPDWLLVFTSQFDAAVFGVGVSAVAYLAVRILLRPREELSKEGTTGEA